MFLVGSLLSIIIDYYFLGLTYIIVYCGAIAIIFLFVIMMVTVPTTTTPTPPSGVKGVAAVFMLFCLGGLVFSSYDDEQQEGQPIV